LIDEITSTEVVIRVNGNPRRLAANQIFRIQFANAPADLLQAAAAYRRGQFNEAKTGLQGVNVGEIQDKWVKEEIAFMLASIDAKSALAGEGDKNAAGTLLLGFINDYAGSFHHFEAVELFADLAYSVGQFKTAAEYYQKMVASPWEEMKVYGTLRLAHATVGLGSFAEALAQYDQVAGYNATTPLQQAIVAEAKAGRARCLGETGKAAEGIVAVEEIIADNDPKTQKKLYAQAYNAQGVCYRKSNKNKDAILAFLHTHLIFNQDPDAHAESLFHLTQLWEAESKADRASGTKTLLQQKYAGTFWENKLRNQ
jgi:tetratricopeptide (TPR) repeat protein